MIALKNITKSYDRNTVLDNISLTVPGKSIAGIIGPNGAGKSTLLRIISGFESPDSGAVYIKETKMKHFYQTKKHIAYMPEYMLIYPDYAVGEFLTFYHSAVKMEDEGLLTMLSLKTVYDKKIKHLSKGWHQRLKLYTALCNRKPMVILDEPFDGFDPLQLRDIIALFKSRNSNGRAFIMSIHQLAYAQKICDYFILLNGGRIIAEGTLDMLKNRFPSVGHSLEDIFLKALER